MPQPVSPDAVFVNIPYDEGFRRLYLAYIIGLTQLGLEPRATLGIPGGERRLDRILALIQSCRYSIHDLSRVQLDRNPPRTPRFNMPFELGLAVTWACLLYTSTRRISPPPPHRDPRFTVGLCAFYGRQRYRCVV